MDDTDHETLCRDGQMFLLPLMLKIFGSNPTGEHGDQDCGFHVKAKGEGNI